MLWAFIVWFVLTLMGVVFSSISGRDGNDQFALNLGWLFHVAALGAFDWVAP